MHNVDFFTCRFAKSKRGPEIKPFPSEFPDPSGFYLRGEGKINLIMYLKLILVTEVSKLLKCLDLGFLDPTVVVEF